MKLTRRQAAIIGAYTGFTCGPMNDIRTYIRERVGGDIGDFAIAALGSERIREMALADFLALCSDDAGTWD